MPGPLNHLLQLRKKYGPLVMLLLKKTFRGETYVPMVICLLSAEGKRQTLKIEEQDLWLVFQSSAYSELLSKILRFFFYMSVSAQGVKGVQEKKPKTLMMYMYAHLKVNTQVFIW